ncbi:ribosome maturation factor RimM [Legionella yabuuchiae]|uniref:ribosome maturation factor RimM n=1 Tax=Legionella yabuuchiae TaxID=376727 RepID=UPI0010562298|nr:ribosome maturation factor RimM [Legionella yabuuchiae]
MNQANDWVIVGRFGRPHGIKGLITVNSFTDPRENILRYTEWHGFINEQWQPLSLTQLEMHSKYILARVEGYTEREQVASLTNVDIGVRGEALPKLGPGEYYWHQLIGLNVVTRQGENLGQVTEMIATGSNDVLVVVGQKRHLIPYLPERVILNVDEGNRTITVDWDEDF